jgi:uncharacterized surface protein with fasciclin (FAS1) repeats
MSDEPTLPDRPATPSAPPPPPPTPASTPPAPSPDEPTLPSTEPTPVEPEPTGLGALASDPTEAPAADPAATEVMPTLPVAGGVVPPIGPPDAPEDPWIGPGEEPDEPTPWYKEPGPVAVLVIVVLAILALLGWLIFGGGDDDDDVATPTSSRLILLTTDLTGASIDVGFAVSVDGPVDSQKSFVWLRPEGFPPGEIAGASTGDTGRVDFEWEADSSVADPASWNSTATIIAQVPPGWTPPGPALDCVRQPLGEDQTTVTLNVALDSADASVARVATMTFPNYSFQPGDSVTCRLAAGAPGPTTVVDTTIVDTTVPVTTPETTPETSPETTTPETTAPPTTTPPTTIPPIDPPEADETLWDVIEREDELQALEDLILAAGLEGVLQDPTATITLFAPTNGAIAAAPTDPGAPDYSDPAVVEAVVLTHVNLDEVLLAADLLALVPPEVVVANPGPHAVNGAVTPPTIGGAALLQVDLVASNGVIHVIDKVLLPAAI